jgi:hypothetical protein
MARRGDLLRHNLHTRGCALGRGRAPRFSLPGEGLNDWHGRHASGCAGAAGVGKTELARALAACKGAELIGLQCYEGLDAGHAIYEWNYQRQLLTIRAAAEDGQAATVMEARLFSEEFRLKRPLLRAIRQADAPVLLIDEIDRANGEVEAYLLEILSDFTVTVPELGTLIAITRPMVILTSNGTRDLSVAQSELGLADLTEDPAILSAALATLLKTSGDRASIAPEVAQRLAGKSA